MLPALHPRTESEARVGGQSWLCHEPRPPAQAGRRRRRAFRKVSARVEDGSAIPINHLVNDPAAALMVWCVQSSAASPLLLLDLGQRTGKQSPEYRCAGENCLA